MSITEQQVEKDLREIKTHLHKISKNTQTPIWRSFFTGTLSGLGSVVGAVIALSILGWILNAIGVIPAFQKQANEWHRSLDNLKQNK